MGQEKILAFRVDVIGVTKEAESIGNLTLSLNKLNEQARILKKQYNENSISADKYTTSLAKNKSQVADVRVALTQLNKAERLSSQYYQSAPGSIDRARIKMRQLKEQMTSLNLTTSEGRAKLQQLQAQYNSLAATTRRYDSQLATTGGTFSRFTKSMGASFRTMAAGLIGITALMRVFRDIIKVTGDFDTAQAQLAAITGKTRDEIADLTKQARELGSTSQYTASQVSDLQTELAKLGFVTEDIKKSTPAIIDFATATGSDLAAAAKTAGVAVRAFGLDTILTGDAVATMAIATTKSALTFADFDTILSTAGPIVRAYKFELEDVVALTGKLKDAGFDASSAATATRNIFLKMADASGDLAMALGGPVSTFDELIDGMVALDASGISLSETLQLTDKRSVAAFNTFLRNAESARELRKGITGVNEELDAMVQTKLDAYEGDVKMLTSAWQEFILSMKAGKVLRGVIQTLKDAILQVTNLGLAFKNFNKQTEEQVTRSFDLLTALSNKQGTEFKEATKDLDKYSVVELLLNADELEQRFAEVRHINAKEAEVMYAEYVRRRQAAIDQEMKLITARNVQAAKLEDERNNTTVAGQFETYNLLKAQIDELEKARGDASLEEALQINAQIRLLKEKLKLYEDSEKIAKATGATGGYALLQEELKKLEQQRANANIEDIAALNEWIDVVKTKMKVFEEAMNPITDGLEEWQSSLFKVKGYISDVAQNIDLDKELARINLAPDVGGEQESPNLETKSMSQLNALKERTQELYEDGIIMYSTYQDTLTAIAEAQEGKRTKIIEAAQKYTAAGFDFLYARNRKLMDMELEAAGENEAKKAAIQKEYAKKNQRIAIIEAIINTASLILKAAQTQPFIPLGLIAAAGAAVLGGLQIATITQQQFAKGGKIKPGNELPGSSRTGDNTLILARPGEVVVNEVQQSALGGPRALRRAGVPGFATGGVVPAPQPNTARMDQQVALNTALHNIRVQMVVNDLHSAERELEIINESPGL